MRADFVLRSSREFYPASLRWPTNVALDIGAPSGPASRCRSSRRSESVRT